MDTETKLIPKTFFWMFLGLFATAIVAWYTYSSSLFIDIIVGGYWPTLLGVEIVVVVLFSFLFRKLSPTVVGILYFIYAAVNGVTLSTVFYVFELGSIVYLFIAAAALFGILAFIGYTTTADLSKWHTMLFMLLFIGIILSLVNIFIGNTMLDVGIDWLILIIFFGITMYDMNKLKNLQYEDGIEQEKVYIYGAMQLYLDFINIFLRILSLFGKRRN